MIVVVEEHNSAEHSVELDQMFRLRARIFQEKLGWSVNVLDGMERDKFDDENPVYIIHFGSRGEVDGACRLLPTTGPTLLAETFFDTIPDAAALASPTIWECTRFCVEQQASQAVVSAAIVIGIGQVAINSGIESILGNFDERTLRMYRRIGCEVDVLGKTDRFGETVYLGLFPVSPSILRRITGGAASHPTATLASLVA